MTLTAFGMALIIRSKTFWDRCTFAFSFRFEFIHRRSLKFWRRVFFKRFPKSQTYLLIYRMAFKGQKMKNVLKKKKKNTTNGKHIVIMNGIFSGTKSTIIPLWLKEEFTQYNKSDLIFSGYGKNMIKSLSYLKNW